jgi:hypothetical protein
LIATVKRTHQECGGSVQVGSALQGLLDSLENLDLEELKELFAEAEELLAAALAEFGDA